MSALTADPSALGPLAVLLASLAGSGHCAAMCGGFAVSVGDSAGPRAHYHFGRFIGYLVLGGLAGLVGGMALSPHAPVWVANAAAFFIGVTLIASGARILAGKPMHFQVLPERFLRSGFRAARGSAGACGLLSALLPCGWLHVFVLGAMSARSPGRGALLLFAFWLGTLPALTFLPWIARRALSPFAHRMPKFAGSMLILIGALNLFAKFQDVGYWLHPESPILCNGISATPLGSR